jgi:hypothetical protein
MRRTRNAFHDLLQRADVCPTAISRISFGFERQDGCGVKYAVEIPVAQRFDKGFVAQIAR